MPITIREPEAKYTPAPEGLHVAVCVDVVDLGIVEGAFGAKHQIELWWQLDARQADTGDRCTVRKRYTASLHEKSSLAKDLVLWRGRPFSPEERRGFDLERLIGACCQLQVVHAVKDDGRTFANVAAVFSAGGKKLQAEAYVRVQDRPKDGAVPAHTATDDADDAIPFAWALPLLLPATGAAYTWLTLVGA